MFTQFAHVTFNCNDSVVQGNRKFTTEYTNAIVSYHFCYYMRQFEIIPNDCLIIILITPKTPNGSCAINFSGLSCCVFCSDTGIHLF